MILIHLGACAWWRCHAPWQILRKQPGFYRMWVNLSLQTLVFTNGPILQIIGFTVKRLALNRSFCTIVEEETTGCNMELC